MRRQIAAFSSRPLGWALCMAVAGCGGSDPSQTISCAAETRADSYSAGMEKSGAQGAVTMRLLESVPGPPQKGDNEWRVMLLGASGTPLTGAGLTAMPFMPDHQHGTSIKAKVQEVGGGEYRISPLNLFMPGLWTVTITAQPPAGSADQAVFAFCIDG